MPYSLSTSLQGDTRLYEVCFGIYRFSGEDILPDALNRKLINDPTFKSLKDIIFRHMPIEPPLKRYDLSAARLAYRNTRASSLVLVTEENWKNVFLGVISQNQDVSIFIQSTLERIAMLEGPIEEYELPSDTIMQYALLPLIYHATKENDMLKRRGIN